MCVLRKTGQENGLLGTRILKTRRGKDIKAMNVLVINCGSSSLKYQLIDSEKEQVLAKGLCERIGIDGSAITHQKADEEKESIVRKIYRTVVSI